MKITSRSRFSLPASAIGISVMASSPGPPASQTIGSGLGFADAAGMMATERVIVRRVGLLRFSGTVSCPQRAVLSSGIGAGISGHAAFPNRYSGSARAKAMPPSSVAMARRAPTAASDPKVVRVDFIWQLRRWLVRNDGERCGAASPRRMPCPGTEVRKGRTGRSRLWLSGSNRHDRHREPDAAAPRLRAVLGNEKVSAPRSAGPVWARPSEDRPPTRNGALPLIRQPELSPERAPAQSSGRGW